MCYGKRFGISKCTLPQPKRTRSDSSVEMNKTRWLHNNDVVHTTTIPLSERATRKTVSFDVDVKVHEVVSRHEYTSDEKKSCWFDAEDFRRRKRVTYAEARLIDWGRFHTIEHVTTVRGLEGRTERGENRKQQHRYNAYDAVFDEIESQEEAGIVDDTAIASSYAIASAPCAAYAKLLADFDEVEARIIYNDPQ